MSTTTIILLLILLVALAGLVVVLAWPRDRTHARLDHVFRVTPQDLWDVVIPHPDRPNLLSEERYEWDAGSTTDADISLFGEVGARFSQRADPAALQAEQTVLVDNGRGEAVVRIIWRITVRPAPDGARIIMEKHIEKIGGRHPRWWTPLPEPAASLGFWLSVALTKSGAFARYDAAHGTVPPSRRVRLWWTAFVLAAVAWGWWTFGPWMTIAVVAGLVLHEAGHVAVMRAFGDRPGAVHVVPFLGGFAIGRMLHATAWQHAAKLLGGPVAGLGSAVAAVLLGWLLDSAYLTSCGYGLALINLMTLAPIPWLDGGELVHLALRPFLRPTALRFFGGAVLTTGFGLSLWWGYRMELLFLAMIMASLGQVPPQPPHLPLPRRDAAMLAVLWLGLAAVLAGMLVWLGGEGGFRDQSLALMLGPFQ